MLDDHGEGVIPGMVAILLKAIETKSTADVDVADFEFETPEDAARGLRPGLRETPQRVFKFYQEVFSGYEAEPDAARDLLKQFENDGNYSEMVFQRGVPFFSTCEHHMVPFFGVMHIAYIPRNGIVGLSKLKRVVDLFSKRLQVQERLTSEIAAAMAEHLSPDVAVYTRARHLCMEQRGVRTVGVATSTTKLCGEFYDKPEVRAEFMSYIQAAEAAFMHL